MFYKTGPPIQFEHFDLWDDSHVGNFIQKFELFLLNKLFQKFWWLFYTFNHIVNQVISTNEVNVKSQVVYL